MPDHAPDPPDPPLYPGSHRLGWAAAVGLLLSAAGVWSVAFAPPPPSGPVAGAKDWSARCVLGGGDPRPAEVSFAKSSAEGSERAARTPGSLTGRRMTVWVEAAEARGVPGVDPGDRVKVVGTVVRFAPGRVELRDGVVKEIDTPLGFPKFPEGTRP